MAKMTGQFQVTCTIRHDAETGSYVARCLEFDLYSAGTTELEAQEAIKSAVAMFLDYAYEQKQLGEILQSIGMQFTSGDACALAENIYAKVGGIDTQTIPIQVPFFLLQKQQEAVSCA